MDLTPELKDKYLKAIETIEHTDRPEKWRLIKKLTFELKPWLKEEEAGHAAACKELRQNNQNKFAASKSGNMRETMKLYGPVFMNIQRLDPEINESMSGANPHGQTIIHKQLWEAFPEYRVARNY